MATTTDYLNKLVTQKNALADNLATKGVTATHEETFETLVPKVLNINGGTGGNGIYPIGEDGRPTGDVIVPKGVTSLNQYVFYNNTNITSVTLPNSVINLNSHCFQDCTGLQSINIPDSVTTISSYCFDGCTSLSQIEISENTNYVLEAYSFQNSGITDSYVIDIVSHASSIDKYTFNKCNSLVNVVVSAAPSGYMFANCTNLKTIEITGSTLFTSVGYSAFRGNKSLESVIIANGITTINVTVFLGCTSLKTVYLPSSITTATNNCLTATSSAYYIFHDCTALEDVQLGQDWNMNLRLNVSSNITVDSMVAMFNSLKDLTGDTAKTLTLGSTNLAKLTDEQKLIATNKNWTLA